MSDVPRQFGDSPHRRTANAILNAVTPEVRSAIERQCLWNIYGDEVVTTWARMPFDAIYVDMPDGQRVKLHELDIEDVWPIVRSYCDDMRADDTAQEMKARGIEP